MKKSSKKIGCLLPFLLLVLAVFFGVYLFQLDQIIHTKFESHRWNLPSRVYSDDFYMYPGQKVPIDQVEDKLKNLNYKKVSQVKDTGEYSRSPNGLQIYLHDFDYPSGRFVGFAVDLEWDEGLLKQIRRFRQVDQEEELKSLRLEPELIGSIFDEKMEDRTVVTLAEIPDELIQALISIEDERFYSHHGADPISIVRAIVMDVLHIGVRQGGSTITQQLVKNYFLTADRTLSRKFKEILMAILLERRYSKEEILEAYFNEIYFGQRGPVSVTGVEEGARFYFSKKVSQLSLSECALMVGLIRGPGYYSPFKHFKRSIERRDFVLKTMLSKNVITQADYEKAISEKIILGHSEEPVFQAPYFIDFVRRQLKENYPESVLQSEGLKIFTTLDMQMQEKAESVVEQKIKSLETERAKIKKLKEEGKLLQVSIISVQPQTGYVKAFVGGRNYGESQFDHVTEAHRQPGSSFKPFVYLTALRKKDEEGNSQWTLASRLDDSSFSVKVSGKNWTPQNYDKSEHGDVSFREALEQSYNLATTKLAIDVGLDKVVELAHEAGIESNLEEYPSLALGAFEVTPLELVRAYTIFPNEGVRSEPISITNVVTREGRVLEKRGFKIKKVIEPDEAYLMNHLMQGVLDHGTAASARTLGYTGLGAGKTGTTSDYKDSWFVGYSPDLLTAVWVGYDDNTTSGLSGASGALPFWAEYMKKVNPPGASRNDFKFSSNVVLVKVSKDGKLYRSECGDFINEAFIKGSEPQESCEPKASSEKE